MKIESLTVDIYGRTSQLGYLRNVWNKKLILNFFNSALVFTKLLSKKLPRPKDAYKKIK